MTNTSVSDRELLIRIDERTANLQLKIEGIQENYVTHNDLIMLEEKVQEVKDSSVNKEQYQVTENIVFGMVAIFLIGIATSLAGSVIRKTNHVLQGIK
jgi:hypothetical protein